MTDFDFEQPTPKKQAKPINLADYIVTVNEIFPDSSPILLQGEVPLFNSGEISLITGEPKTKKTFLISFFIATLLAKETNVGARHALPFEHSQFTTHQQNNILLVDTEQGRKRTNNVVRRIYRLLNLDFEKPIQNFTAISIRELSANERFLVLEKAVKEHQFSIVFLDGFADLIQNTNDLEECARKVSDLMKLSEDHNTHICSVVHTNPFSDKTRGHVGSELQRKCETVMLVKKDGDISTVSPQFCRNREFEKFSFFINPNGLPELCEQPPLVIQAQHLFTSIFKDLSEINYKELTQIVMKKESVAIRTAERRISTAVEMNVLKKNDDGSYSLDIAKTPF
jgi:hypothetical protein